jgi:hypothetical protein
MVSKSPDSKSSHEKITEVNEEECNETIEEDIKNVTNAFNSLLHLVTKFKNIVASIFSSCSCKKSVNNKSSELNFTEYDKLQSKDKPKNKVEERLGRKCS